MGRTVKVFIDLGAYNGDTIELALKCIPGIDHVYGFEPLQRPFEKMCERYSGSGYHLQRVAADVEDGESRVYVGNAYGDISSSLNVNNPNCDPNQFELISKIDFPKWLKDNFDRPSDRFHLILKMNIEGGEYAILQRMMDDGTITLIDELYCDWHWYYVGMSEAEHHQVVRRLRRFGLKLCGDKPDELYNALQLSFLLQRCRVTMVYFKRAMKLLLQDHAPRLFRLLKTMK